MRITRAMLRERVKELNRIYHLDLTFNYHNGCTWVYRLGSVLTLGTTPECYNALAIFMSGVFAGMNMAKENE